VQQEDGCWTLSGNYDCHLTFATDSNGSQLTIAGDSGGPVYETQPDGSVQAWGIINGCNGNCSLGATNVYFTLLLWLPAQFKVMTTSSATPTMSSTIRTQWNGRCLYVSQDGSNGSPILLFDCYSGWLSETWYFPADGTVRSSWNGRCLDATAAYGGGNGNPIQLYDCLGGSSQIRNETIP